MSTARLARRRRTRLRAAAATVLAAAAGVVLGSALAPAGEESGELAAGQGVGLMSGVARLPLPVGWEPLARRSFLPGLRDATAVRAVYSDVALDIRAPEHPSLLPADVVAAMGGRLPSPRVERLDGGRAAWRYDLPAGLGALVLPTTGGVVTIACQADIGATRRAQRECAGAMRGLQLRGASALPPAPETAARIVLPEVVDQLNERREAGRRALAATRSGPARSAAARRIADAYDAAADRLRPLAAGAAGTLTTALARLARDHRALATASVRRRARAARRAGAAIGRGERRITALLANVSGR